RLQCSLVIRSLNSSIKYQALSYTWGKPDAFNFKIWINGILVPVRRNLLCALRARSLIWVDALCIDQNNIVERGHQVDMMGDIFRDAEEVLTWLG
ncbi:HET-domain-containing protein, partial [Cadophora sp. DSE1049]